MATAAAATATSTEARSATDILPAVARRSPHQGEADEAEARPGQCVQTETKIDCLRAANCHEPGRRGQGECQVAARRHVEGMQHEDGDEEHDQWLLDIRNAVHRARHCVEEPHGDADGPRRDERPSSTPAGATWSHRRNPYRATPARLPHNAVTSEISPIDAAAAIATMTAPRQATRSATECSGRPGRLALRIVSRVLISIRSRRGCAMRASGTARARRRPAPRRSATRATTGPDASTVARWTGAPRSSNCTTVPRARSATRSASSGSAGSVTVTVTGSDDGPSSSLTISSPACAVARQCTRRRLSPGR